MYTEMKLSLCGTPNSILPLCSSCFELRLFHFVVPPFCVSSNIKTVYALVLEYLVAFYPICLILITYVSSIVTTLGQLFGYGSHFTDILLT